MCLVYMVAFFSGGFWMPIPFKKAQAKDIVLGVNGEIYNYTDLQDSLEARFWLRFERELAENWCRIFGHLSGFD